MLFDVYLVGGGVVVKGNPEAFNIFEVEEFHDNLPDDVLLVILPAGSVLPDGLSCGLCDD